MEKPEVSIITPVYNGYKYIQAAADSIFSQTFTDFEWLIIDDSSTDRTHVVLQQLQSRDGRVQVFRMNRNKGPIHARNEALKAAQGRFIAFLDIDDNWMPEKLRKHVAFMKKTGAGLSYTSYRKFDNNGRVTSRFAMPIPRRITHASMKRTCSIMASSAMYDTEQTGRMLQDPAATVKDDLHFWLRILEKVQVGYGLKDDLARLRIHSDSLTGNKKNEAAKQWRLYRHILKLSLAESLYCFCHYAFFGTIKYIL